MSKRRRKNKNGKAMENQDIKEQEVQEENLENEARTAKDNAAEDGQSEEDEVVAETQEEDEADIQTEPETENGTGSADAPDEKKGRKERKLKWAKQASDDAEKAEKASQAFEDKIKEANDKYARLFAEFDNFRKRSEKEKAQRYDFGAKDMVEKILPVIDNFERGLNAVPEDQKEDSFVKGMEMTYKQLLKALEDAGVRPIDAVGREFDPEFHNAVMHVDDPDAGNNIVVEEFQKGYMYKDQVVRYSMVKVAN